MDNKMSGKRIARYLRKLNIKEDTILLIKSHSPLADKENMDALLRALKVLKLTRVIIGVVDDINAIRPVSEADMNNAGWYHIKTLKGLLAKTNTNPLRTKETDEKGT